MIRVVIVDDSALIRELLNSVLSVEPDILVVGMAGDPHEARHLIKTTNPDVITLDIEMPHMDGLSFLEKIMRLRPMPVIMFSSLTEKNSLATIKALELGAFDCVVKSGNNIHDQTMWLKAEIPSKVRAAAQSKPRSPTLKTTDKQKLTFDSGRSCADIIAIGSSTGGVEALREILPLLPANAPPIVIVQHMPADYTAKFAQRLDSICDNQVCEATHNQTLQSGHIYIAPGGQHLEIKRNANGYSCVIGAAESVSGHQPSVDVLFDSVAKQAGQRAIGVILTGMGRDGADGLLTMRRNGATTIAQNEKSCVVYGMPRAAVEQDAASLIAPLEEIAVRIIQACSHVHYRKVAHA